MKLNRITIKKLYDHFDYDVTLNQDLTILYGSNGSGKTTILDIISKIVTGEIISLVNYKFDEITLYYKKDIEDSSIVIKSFGEYIYNEIPIEEDIYIGKKFEITFNKKKYTIDNFGDNDKTTHYTFLKEIKSTFNYVYLPINRKFSLNDNINKRKFVSSKHRGEDSMDAVLTLIRGNFIDTSSKINYINDKFRNEILSNLIDFNMSNEKEDIFEYIKQIHYYKEHPQKLRKLMNRYILFLIDLNIIHERESVKYTNFIELYIIALEEFDDADKGVPTDLILKLHEINKLQKTIELAKKVESEKNEIYNPIRLFLDIVNTFINSSGTDEKQIIIGPRGIPRLRTKYSEKGIPLKHLSSGEKQIITFFANLVFNVSKKGSGIFIVDEPELSIHLTWQSMFLEKALGINSNVQFIFATHSPEIIGPYYDKTVELIKYESEEIR